LLLSTKHGCDLGVELVGCCRQSLRESVLHCIVRGRLVTEDCCRYAQEPAVALPIDTFNLAGERLAHAID
jgi:hypothetical protein